MSSLFFTAEDLSRNIEKANQIANPLDRLNDRIPWEMFRPILVAALKEAKPEAKGPGGRPAFDPVLMFKVTLLQRFYNLSDAQTELQILDRLSFQRFLGIQPGATVPDEKTIWLFREHLTRTGTEKKLFKEFDRFLKDHKMIVKGGVIVDSSFIEMPRQHMNEDEQKSVEEGKTPSEWGKFKVRQKDIDARWTKKNSRSYYGYKNHVKADAGSKLILDWGCTDAAVHDSQMFKTLITPEDKGQQVLADCAYQGTAYIIHTVLCKADWDVCEKAEKNWPLTEEQKQENRRRARTRSRIEHIFGFMENSMNGMRLRSIGKQRAQFNICMMNLVYNFFRFDQLQRT